MYENYLKKYAYQDTTPTGSNGITGYDKVKSALAGVSKIEGALVSIGVEKTANDVPQQHGLSHPAWTHEQDGTPNFERLDEGQETVEVGSRTQRHVGRRKLMGRLPPRVLR